MPLDPTEIHAQRYPRIGGIIDESTERIMRAWWRRSRADQPGASFEDAADALARVRGFLRSLARQLASTDPEASLTKRPATGLGELRWKQGEEISQVVRDYQILRLVLIEHLDRELDTPLTRDEWTAHSLSIDEAIDAAVSAFSEQEARARDEHQRELEQSNRELQRFAHVVAHELKSPLNAQALGIKLLELQVGKEHFDENARQPLQTAINSVEQMKDLINELLRYAEIEAEDESEPQPTPCDAVISQVLENLTVEITKSGAEILYSQLPVVLAKPTGLLLLLQNLIGNAIHYRGKRRPQIRIEASDADDFWLFRVADNGAGIPPEDQTRIFQMFVRAHEQLRPRGTGIGLAMCRRIVEDGGGRIWVESQPGCGSTFFFTLPKAGKPSQTAQNQHRAVPA
jgi:signal transduction histidine kinase